MPSKCIQKGDMPVSKERLEEHLIQQLEKMELNEYIRYPQQDEYIRYPQY